MASWWVCGLALVFTVFSADAELFKTFPGTLKFSDANSFCQSQGMVLPVLTSPLEQSLALAALGATPEFEYWIGLNYFTGDFQWGDNSALCWENWFVSSANEPNNLATELCVAMRGQGSVPGAWLTKNCGNKYGIICQHYEPAGEGIFGKYIDFIPSSIPLTSLPVWTETACVLLCDLTPDCKMATFDPGSKLCTVYDCHSQMTSTSGRVTWIKQ